MKFQANELKVFGLYYNEFGGDQGKLQQEYQYELMTYSMRKMFCNGI